MTIPARPILAALAAALALLAPASLASPPACGITPTGCEAWTTTYAGVGKVGAPDTLVSPDDTLLLTAIDQVAPNHTGIVLVGNDAATGHLLWATPYVESDGAPTFQAVSLSVDGSRLYVTGTSRVGPLGIPRMFLLSLDAHTGAILWTQQQALGSEGTRLALSPDGRTVYTLGALNSNFAVFTYDAATGNAGWVGSYDWQGGYASGFGSSYDIVFGSALSHDGARLYLTGIVTAPSGAFQYGTLALNASNGGILWSQRAYALDALGSPISSEAYSIHLSPDEARVYVFGTAGVFAYDSSTGSSLWTAPLVGCRAYWPRIYHECQLWVSPDGGTLYVFTHDDLGALDAQTGNVKWLDVLRVDSDNNGLGRSAVLSPDGSRLYVTVPGGRDDQATDTIQRVEYNYDTQAFDTSNGLLRWNAIYGDGHQEVHDIAVSPDGSRVYVTGRASPPSGPAVAETVAYPTNLGFDNDNLLSI